MVDDGREANRKRLFEMIDEIHERTKDIPAEELEADIVAAIREAREEIRAADLYVDRDRTGSGPPDR